MEILDRPNTVGLNAIRRKTLNLRLPNYRVLRTATGDKQNRGGQ